MQPPLPTYRHLAMKALVSLQSSPRKEKKKKIHSLPLAFALSFSSSQARLLTPTPFLSAPFKSKQKTHLVCLLAPFSPLSLSFSLTPSLFLLRVFFNCFYQCKSSTLLVGRAGWRSFVQGSTTRLKTVAGVQFAVKRRPLSPTTSCRQSPNQTYIKLPL